MAAFTYRCSNTALQIQAWTDAAPNGDDVFEMVTCTACQQAHLVNPKTGEVVGTDKIDSDS